MIGWTLLFGYAFHLFLARVTPFHYVYLTGHMIWIHAGAYAILYHSFGLSTALTVALASLTVGTYFTLAPAAAQPIMRRITGSDEVAFGHGQTILNLVAAGAGSVVGKGSRTTEEMRVPEKLNFFRDIAISTTLVMLVVAFAAALLALAEVGVGGFEKAFVEQLPDGQSWVVFTLLKALGFTAGMLILLFGVRMLIAEIVPAFHGIAERLIPGAKPALDVPVIFPFAPNALIIGLISGLIGQIAGMAFLVAIDWPVPIPSMIVAFFASGAGAIFGNATGGRRGAWLGGFLWGFIGWLMISYAYQEQVFGNLTDMGATGLAFTVPDAIIPAIIIDLIAKLFGG
jgi:PTS system ascorbate-specific IIC component